MNYRLNEIDHKYGSQVHILSDPSMTSWLSRLCSPNTHQPMINLLVDYLYTGLMQTVMNREFPRKTVTIPTRMSTMHPQSPYTGEILDTEQRIVTVNLARAGTYPSHVCYHMMNNVMNPQMVRQDHILASRTTNTKEEVTGTQIGSHKIGGDIRDAIVIFPDPMGATGNTIVTALKHYKEAVGGKAKKFVALHLIVTPEYLKYVLKEHSDVQIYAVRVDRGLSSQKVLDSVPGTHWNEERGLNDKHYIVPGGGGFGEIMNNSFV